MSYYVCIGKTNYYATLDKPIYAEFIDPTFIDYFDWMVGYAKTVEELNLVFPFPKNYVDSDRRIWVLRDGTVQDNHQFLRKREYPQKSQLEWTPRNKEKQQDPKPAWSYTEQGSLWRNLKGNKLNV